jgi:hypothetical protein
MSLATLKPATIVDVSPAMRLFHRPGLKDPKHFGRLRMRLDDAQKVAEPCRDCFPEERTAA